MSSFLGTSFENTPVQSAINAPLIQTVLAMKQGQYDANKAKLQAGLDQLASTSVLRPQDQEYIQAKMKDLTTKINDYGSVDMSQSYQADDLFNMVKSVAKDPFIQNAIANTRKFQNYNVEVDEIKKKKPELYSDVNYQDGLEQGGLDKYMKGESNNIGELRYQQYTNLPEKLSKKADDYVKTMGMEKLLDTTTGEYYISDVYGKRVSMQEIYGKLESELDEKDRVQLQINTRQSIGKLSPEKRDEVIKPFITNKIDLNKDEKSALEAQYTSETDKDKKQAIKLKIAGIDTKIKNYTEQLDKKTYDIYGVYQQSFLEGIASNYDVEAITDIKRNDIPFQIKKFEFDVMNSERNYALKLREVQAKEKEQKTQEQLSSPTMVDKPQEGQEQKPSETILYESFSDSDKMLDTYLTKTNENNYNQKSESEKWAYKKNLKSDDPTVSSVERQNIIKNFNTNLQGYTNIINGSKNILKGNTSKMFNGITGANLNNLAGELPYTSALLKQNKKFEDLDGNQQAAVMVEMGSNVAKYMADSRQRKILMSTVNSLSGQLAQHKSEKVKSIYNIVKKATDSALVPQKENRGGTAFSSTAAMLYSPPNRKDKYSPFTEDTDVTELEAYTGDSTIGGVDVFQSMLNDMVKNAEKVSDGYKSNLLSNKAMAWSTNIKEQQQDAIQLQQTIQANFPDKIPNNTNNYVVNRKGTGFEITYSTGSGDKLKTDKVYVEKLSDNLMSKFNLQEQKWNSSFENPNIIIPEYTFSAKNKKESYDTFKNIALNRPDLIPPDVYINLHNRKSLAGTEYQSDEDILEWVSQQPSITPEKQKQILNVLGAKFEPKYQVFNGLLTGEMNVTLADGRQDSWLAKSDLKELDEGRLYIETLKSTMQYKKEQIEKILNGGNR